MLLFVALSSGYYFIVRFLPTRYYSARESGYRLYFRAAFWGIVLAFAASLMLFPIYLRSADGAVEFGGLPAMYLEFVAGAMGGLSVMLSLPLAMLAASVLNLFYRSQEAKTDLLRRVFRSRDFEKLILRALETSQTLLVTLDTGKVYVGWIVEAPDPSEVRKHLRIMPVASGYRQRENREVKFVKNYKAVITQIMRMDKSALAHLMLENFEMVIPSDRIVSAHIFNMVAYRYFTGRDVFDKDARG